MRFVDRSVSIISLLWPLIGVLWLEWDIGSVIFLYTCEAAIITVVHIVTAIRTDQAIDHPDIRTGYRTSVTFRLLTEGVIVFIAFMLFVDAVVGGRTILFEHLDIILQYGQQTFVPLAALLYSYGRKLWQPIEPSQLLPAGWWLLYMPVPLYVCSFILSYHFEQYLPVLLTIVVGCKIAAEVRLFRSLPALPEPTYAAGVMTGSPYAIMPIVRSSALYLIVLVGFMSTNPWTLDPRYSQFENGLIFLGFALLWVACLRIPRVRVEFKDNIIQYEQHGWWTIRRIIAVSDIKNIKKIIHPRKNQLSGYIYIIKNQRPWRFGPTHVLRQDWEQWVEVVHHAIL